MSCKHNNLDVYIFDAYLLLTLLLLTSCVHFLLRTNRKLLISTSQNPTLYISRKIFPTQNVHSKCSCKPFSAVRLYFKEKIQAKKNKGLIFLYYLLSIDETSILASFKTLSKKSNLALLPSLAIHLRNI